MLKISIITPVFNGEKTIEKTIKSVIDQDYQNYEHIIIDSSSTDETLEIVNKYKDKIFKIISEPDKGIYEGINKGLKICTGEIICTLNSGDFFYDNALKTVANYFHHDKNLDFLFGTVQKKKILYKYEPKKLWWSFNFYPAHSGGFFITKKAQNILGPYNLRYKCSSDYDLFWRMIKVHKMNGGITKKNEIISHFTPGGFSSKLSLFEHMLEETNIRINNKQNKLVVLGLFIAKFFKHYFKI